MEWFFDNFCGVNATSCRFSTRYGAKVSDQSIQRERGSEFLPKFDDKGLLSAVVQHHETGEVLMVAFMDMEAIEATKQTGLAHFHSRSRGKLWQKGETSGDVLHVHEILVDCDQDAMVLKCRPEGPTCHTGARSCFYRHLDNGALHPVKS